MISSRRWALFPFKILEVAIWSVVIAGSVVSGGMEFLGLVYLNSLWNNVQRNKTIEAHLSRKHLVVWFDYSVRYYDHEAENSYSKDDLSAMANVISKRFSKLAIDTAPVLDKCNILLFEVPPEKDAHSRVWIPEVVAALNRAYSTPNSSLSAKHPHYSKMEVIVSFDVAKIVRTNQVTSFDVAKYMADTANAIYPGTVKTLMMYTGFSIFSMYFNVKDTVQQLKLAREKIHGNSSTNKYDLAVFLDLRDCGHFKGSLGQKAKEFLPHVEVIATLLRPNYHQMTFTPEILHKMFVAKFEDCERKLKAEKPGIRVIPSVLWMARKRSVSRMAQCWQMMSDWGRKHDKEVIMYEAFDTPHGHLLSDQGWWRLKDRSDHEIREEAFIEKVQGGNEGDDNANNLLPSWEDSDETDGTPGGSPPPSYSHTLLFPRSSGNEDMTLRNDSHQALYIALILLSVICTLLVAVIVGLVYGLRSMVLLQSPSRRALTSPTNSTYCNGRETIPTIRCLDSNIPHEEEEDASSASMSGPFLEIRDTTPIFAVTYKK